MKMEYRLFAAAIQLINSVQAKAKFENTPNLILYKDNDYKVIRQDAIELAELTIFKGWRQIAKIEPNGCIVLSLELLTPEVMPND